MDIMDNETENSNLSDNVNVEEVIMGSVLSREKNDEGLEDNEDSLAGMSSSVETNEKSTLIDALSNDDSVNSGINSQEDSNKSTKTAEESLETYTKNLSVQDINLIIMGNPATSETTERVSGSADSDGELLQQDILISKEEQRIDNVQENFEDIVHDLEEILDENSESCKLSKGFSSSGESTIVKDDINLETKGNSDDLVTKIKERHGYEVVTVNEVKAVEGTTSTEVFSPKKLKLVRSKEVIASTVSTNVKVEEKEKKSEMALIEENYSEPSEHKIVQSIESKLKVEPKIETTSRKIKLKRNFQSADQMDISTSFSAQDLKAQKEESTISQEETSSKDVASDVLSKKPIENEFLLEVKPNTENNELELKQAETEICDLSSDSGSKITEIPAKLLEIVPEVVEDIQFNEIEETSTKIKKEGATEELIVSEELDEDKIPIDDDIEDDNKIIEDSEEENENIEEEGLERPFTSMTEKDYLINLNVEKNIPTEEIEYLQDVEDSPYALAEIDIVQEESQENVDVALEAVQEREEKSPEYKTVENEEFIQDPMQDIEDIQMDTEDFSLELTDEDEDAEHVQDVQKDSQLTVVLSENTKNTNVDSYGCEDEELEEVQEIQKDSQIIVAQNDDTKNKNVDSYGYEDEEPEEVQDIQKDCQLIVAQNEDIKNKNVDSYGYEDEEPEKVQDIQKDCQLIVAQNEDTKNKNVDSYGYEDEEPEEVQDLQKDSQFTVAQNEDIKNLHVDSEEISSNDYSKTESKDVTDIEDDTDKIKSVTVEDQKYASSEGSSKTSHEPQDEIVENAQDLETPVDISLGIENNPDEDVEDIHKDVEEIKKSPLLVESSENHFNLKEEKVEIIVENVSDSDKTAECRTDVEILPIKSSVDNPFGNQFPKSTEDEVLVLPSSSAEETLCEITQSSVENAEDAEEFIKCAESKEVFSNIEVEESNPPCNIVKESKSPIMETSIENVCSDSKEKEVNAENVASCNTVENPEIESVKIAENVSKFASNSTKENILLEEVTSSQTIAPESLICESSCSKLKSVNIHASCAEVSSSSTEEKIRNVFEPLQEIQVSSATQESADVKKSKEASEVISQSVEEVTANVELKPKSSSDDMSVDVLLLSEQHNENITKPLTIVVDDDTVSSTKVLTPKRSHEGRDKKSGHYSPKITIKPILKPQDEPSIPKVTIKTVTTSEYSSQLSSNEDNEINPLKLTIKKQKTEESHSILKIYNPEEGNAIPKLTIKPIVKPDDAPHSPKLYKSHKSSNISPGQSSPRITIKPVVKPESVVSPLKLTIKSVLKPEETVKQMSPKLTIKPIMKPDGDITVSEALHHSPRITIKPIVKPPDEKEREQSPIKLTIKAIPKRDTSPKITIKPIVKPITEEHSTEGQTDLELIEYEDAIKPERIVLKIQKNSLSETKKADSEDREKIAKLKKIKLKLGKDGSQPQIINVRDGAPNSLKRFLAESASHSETVSKQMRLQLPENLSTSELSISLVQNEPKMPAMINQDVTITRIENKPIEVQSAKDVGIQSRLKEMLLKISKGNEDSNSSDDVKIISVTQATNPLLINEESDDVMIIETSDPLCDPMGHGDLEITAINPQNFSPKKRGRPRKVPLEVREEFNELPQEVLLPQLDEVIPFIPKVDDDEPSRPKRSCRGPSARAALGLKERKPRGAARGKGSVKKGGVVKAKEKPVKPPRIPKLSKAKIRKAKALARKEAKALMEAPFKELPVMPEPSKVSTTPVVGYEEETRMSAESSSRAQTPARQVVSNIPSSEGPEESQSSVQSSATTESSKARRAVGVSTVEPEGTIISADQLAEYSWGGGGPYMLQEQVAQYLGVKSFKRKYPGMQRRPVDMQERDFIRESGLASEAMCDLGLTAVPSADVLDIMYTDFQQKYEEYCKHQRDRQAKDLTNKQKALSLATSQEKNKIDITEQALQSAASWNSNFNRTRKENRKACMDLQTMTIHFPQGKIQTPSKGPVGNYPIALVPGQFTDYYRTFSSTELKHLPLNSVQLGPLLPGETIEEEDISDGSQSDSDSSSSDSDSSDSDSSIDEDCKMCISAPSTPITKKVTA